MEALRGGDERFPGGIAERNGASPGQPVVGRHTQRERLTPHLEPGHVVAVRTRRTQRDICFVVQHPVDELGAGALVQPDLGPGMAGGEGADELRGQPGAQGVQEVETHQAGFGVEQPAHLGLGQIELGDSGPDSATQCLSADIETQRSTMPIEQGGAHPLLQSCQPARQGGLRNAQLGGSITHMLGLGEHEEPRQIIGQHSARLIPEVHRFRHLYAFPL